MNPLFRFQAARAKRRRPALATPARSVLFVATHCPTRAHAGGLRLLDLADRLRMLAPGIALDVFTFRNPADDWRYDEVEAAFDRVYYADTVRLTYDLLLSQRPTRLDYDVVSFEYVQRPQNVLSFLPHAGRLMFTPMELNARAQAEALSAEEEIRRRRQSARERELCRLVDEVVCVAEADAEFARRAMPFAKIAVLETGVSEIELAGVDASARREPFTVLFLAYFGAAVNIEALQWYLDGVHPRLIERFADYRLDVVGRGDLSAFRPYVGPALNLIGGVDKIGPPIARAAVGVAPAISGAGFRGKINQYAYLGTPTVASPLAARGFAYRDGEEILIADSAAAFADAVAALLADPARREAMGAAARAVCAAHYAWATKDDEIRRLFNLS